MFLVSLSHVRERGLALLTPTTDAPLRRAQTHGEGKENGLRLLSRCTLWLVYQRHNA
jgi:hypothetical protein